MPELTVKDANGERKQVINAEVISIGRAKENDVVVSGVKSSRKHCRIERIGSVYRCIDLKSLNGTFVNGIPISEAILKNGDKVEVGSGAIEITFYEKKKLNY